MSVDTEGRRGRQPVEDPMAPLGRDDNGEPIAPYGFLSDGRPRRYPLVRTDLPDLEADSLGMPSAPPPDLLGLTRPTYARSEQQLHMDDVVASMHRTWIDQDSPTTWNDLADAGCIGGYWVNPEAVDGLKRLISRAVNLFGLRVKYGTPLAGPEGSDYEGKEYISFVIMDVNRRRTDDDDE
jgi:hypothetical protein